MICTGTSSGLVLSPDRDQIDDAPLSELAFDRRHPRAAGASIWTRRMQENARVSHELAAVSPLSPLVLHDQMIVAVGPPPLSKLVIDGMSIRPPPEER